jgi:hypothetical protein
LRKSLEYNSGTNYSQLSTACEVYGFCTPLEQQLRRLRTREKALWNLVRLAGITKSFKAPCMADRETDADRRYAAAWRQYHQCIQEQHRLCGLVVMG